MEKFTQKAREALRLAAVISKELNQHCVGTEHILCGLIRQKSGVAGRVLQELGAEESVALSLIEKYVSRSEGADSGSYDGYTPSAARILEESTAEASPDHGEPAGTGHILLAMMKDGDCIGMRILNTMGISLQRLYIELVRAMGMERPGRNGQEMGKAAESSSTPTLDSYTRDLTQLAAEEKLDPVVGRRREIMRVTQILSRRTKNNPCLIGEPGVGKTAVVEGLAQLIVRGEVPETIRGKRLLNLDISGMVAGTKYRGEFEERIKRVIAEASGDGDVLLFIDELHTIIGAGGAEGALDAANILKPALARGELQIIGATTIEEYRKRIEKDAALERRFQPVTVEEPSVAESVEILKGLRPLYEKHHQVKITDTAIEEAVRMSERYIGDRNLPDKAIDLVDEAASRLRITAFVQPKGIEKTLLQIRELEDFREQALTDGDLTAAGEATKKLKRAGKRVEKLEKEWKEATQNSELTVTENEIADVVSSWTRIPVSRLNEKETEKIRNLDMILHERIVSQDEAVTAIAKAIRRGRTGIKDPKRPIGSFMFLGPTGVGKTELTKALAEALFGTENALIRVDMSEYMEKHSVSKMIGSPPGYVGFDEGGQLSEKIRRNPYSVILFDEIEKAHPDVFNILLQVLDDGHITDAQGRKVDFKNTIIIMTSNAGAENIVSPKKLGFSSGEDAARNYNDMKDKVMSEVKRLFRPEFLNRIDEIIVFRQLDRDNMRSIVEILLKDIKKRLYSEMKVTLKVSEEARDFLIEKGYDEKYGARPLKRAIQSHVEDRLAEAMLDSQFGEGDRVEMVKSPDGETLDVRRLKAEGKGKKEKNGGGK